VQQWFQGTPDRENYVIGPLALYSLNFQALKRMQEYAKAGSDLEYNYLALYQSEKYYAYRMALAITNEVMANTMSLNEFGEKLRNMVNECRILQDAPIHENIRGREQAKEQVFFEVLRLAIIERNTINKEIARCSTNRFTHD
jgi:hypothetical protein